MRKALIAGNFKMNKTSSMARDYARELAAKINKSAPYSDREILLCPPFTALQDIAKEIANSPIILGGQNMHNEEDGAFTGEISASMLIDIGCQYVILGHSERRHIFKETDSFINSKVKKALLSGLNPILCVGELIEERETGIAETVVKNQIENGLLGIEKDIELLVIAYEPVWAIGTGKTATPTDAQDMHVFIRKTVSSLFGKDISDKLVIQYGGSVKPASINSLMAMDDIDGVLVGGACLDVSSFLDIIKFNS